MQQSFGVQRSPYPGGLLEAVNAPQQPSDVAPDVARLSRSSLGAMANGQVEFMRKWLGESGYGLELRLATALAATGGTIGQSMPYTDPIEGRLREADVIHTREVEMDRKHLVRLISIMECKGGKKIPWAVFDRPDSRDRRMARNQAVIHAEDFIVRERIDELLSDDELFNFEWFGNSVVAAREGKDTDDINPANRAVRQVVSATYGVAAMYKGTAGANVFLPVVVTAAPLLTCRLAANSSEIEINPTEYAQVRAVPEGEQRSLIVHVMSESYASLQFAEATARLARRLGDAR